MKKRDALERVIDSYAAYVGTVVSRIIGGVMSREDVEEVVSDVFLALWKHAQQLEPEKGELKGYLAAIARNLAKNKLRQLKNTVSLEGDEIFPGSQGQVESTESAALRREMAEVLRQFVWELGEPDREIFLRYYYSYEKVEEIAAVLGMNPSTVKTRLARGRKKLKEKLEERGYGDETGDYRLAQ